jgi:hypothetical protein
MLVGENQHKSLGSLAQTSDFILISCSAFLTAQITNFRNENEEQSFILLMQQRIIGELSYVALVAASITEGVARSILVIFLIPFLLSIPYESDCFEFLGEISLVGAIFSFENAVISAIALIQNIYQRVLNFDEIEPTIKTINTEIFTQGAVSVFEEDYLEMEDRENWS